MSGTPSRAARSTPAGWNAPDAPSRRAMRTSATTSTIPMPVCATTVPHADPGTPRCSPYTNHTLSRAFTLNPATETASGVRVSWNPRRTPVTAIVTSIPGMPKAATLRYAVACVSTSPDAPSSRQTGSTSAQAPAADAAPSSSDSHSPSMPADAAARGRPAPIARATTDVVPYARNTKTLAAVDSTEDATPSPASCATPRWPTIAESTRRNSGSATSARNDGTARRRICARIGSSATAASLRASPGCGSGG